VRLVSAEPGVASDSGGGACVSESQLSRAVPLRAWAPAAEPSARGRDRRPACGAARRRADADGEPRLPRPAGPPLPSWM